MLNYNKEKTEANNASIIATIVNYDEIESGGASTSVSLALTEVTMYAKQSIKTIFM